MMKFLQLSPLDHQQHFCVCMDFFGNLIFFLDKYEKILPQAIKISFAKKAFQRETFFDVHDLCDETDLYFASCHS